MKHMLERGRKPASRSGKAVSAWALSTGGIAEGVCKMALGNRIGFKTGRYRSRRTALYLKNYRRHS